MNLESLMEENSSLKQQAERYKALYEEIEERIQPFKKQLGIYFAEREALIANENESEEKVKNLFEKFAGILSHHNPRQKIHHIVKLKEELATARKETIDFRKLVAMYKSQIDQLNEKINKLEGKRRFDPKKAFEPSNKENMADDN